MRKIRCAIWAAVLASLMSVHPSAQVAPGLHDAIKRSFAEGLPGWRLVKENVIEAREDAGFDALYYRLGVGEQVVEVLAIVNITKQGASQAYTTFSKEFGLSGFRMKVRKDEPAKFGDESYEWEDFYGRGQKGVAFRHGNVVVHINARDMGLATQCAAHLISALPLN